MSASGPFGGGCFPYWDDEDRPVFSHQDTVFLRAVELGCTPVYVDYAWRCYCAGTVHGISTGHTVISLPSLVRAKHDLDERK